MIDQNISPRVVAALAESFPGSVHVRDLGLASASDAEIWEYAKTHGLAILSKDADFHQRSLVFGHPPKVAWIRRGNCSTQTIISILATYRASMDEFFLDTDAAFLILE